MKVVDMHLAIPLRKSIRIHKKGRQAVHPGEPDDAGFEKMQARDYGLQNFALYVNLEQAKGRPFEFCMELLDTFHQEMEAP